MDVRKYSVFIICLIYNSGNAFDLEKCNLAYDLRGEKGDIGDMGPKGEKGLKGLQGFQAMKGDPGKLGEFIPGKKGIRGDPGEDGPPSKIKGEPGQKGDKGQRGDRGDPGKNGVKGERGERGLPGLPGPKGPPGKVGELGPKGSSGIIGPPGTTGNPGTCLSPPSTYDYTGDSETLYMPCKFNYIGSGLYEMSSLTSSFYVYCNMTTLETCIRGTHKVNQAKSLSNTQPVWLGMNILVDELYKLNVQQITWLQERSLSARQTIKFWCKNITPYSRNDFSKSIQLLTWNDVVIGPLPSKSSPLFYSVPVETDFCSVVDGELRSTIINIHSSNKYRLPVTDILINDFDNDLQREIYIENVELCFG